MNIEIISFICILTVGAATAIFQILPADGSSAANGVNAEKIDKVLSGLENHLDAETASQLREKMEAEAGTWAPNEMDQMFADAVNTHKNLEANADAKELALTCDEVFRPLWDRFRAFENDPEFARAGFGAARFNRWKNDVLVAQDLIYDKSLSARQRLVQAPCEREDIGLPSDAAQFGVETSPDAIDLIHIGQGVFRETEYSLQRAAKSRDRMYRFLNYIDFLNHKD